MWSDLPHVLRSSPFHRNRNSTDHLTGERLYLQWEYTLFRLVIIIIIIIK